MPSALLLAVALTAPPATLAKPADPFTLRPADRVVLLGGTLVEREQKFGDWELALLAHNPGIRFTVRNLGWSGDTVFGEARNAFDDSPAGFGRLVTLTRDLKPTVVVVGYGQAESFAGPAGVAAFTAGADEATRRSGPDRGADGPRDANSIRGEPRAA